MSRPRKEQDSSLELLLDAICNTFGGVLFLAILVAVLLSMRPNKSQQQEETPGVPEETWLDLQVRLQQAQNDYEALQKAAAEQDRLAQQFAEPDIVRQLEQLHQLRQQYDRLQGERAKQLEAIAASEARRAKVLNDLAALDATLAQREEELKQIKAELDKEVEQRTQTAELPYLRRATTISLAVVVRYNRLYLLHRYTSFGLRAGLNTEEFVILDDGLVAVKVTPKPYAGRPLTSYEACQQALSEIKERFPPGRYHLDLAIWTDSFDCFQQLKRAAVDTGYRYRLVLAEEGDGIVDRGGSDGRVQ